MEQGGSGAQRRRPSLGPVARAPQLGPSAVPLGPAPLLRPSAGAQRLKALGLGAPRPRPLSRGRLVLLAGGTPVHAKGRPHPACAPTCPCASLVSAAARPPSDLHCRSGSTHTTSPLCVEVLTEAYTPIEAPHTAPAPPAPGCSPSSRSCSCDGGVSRMLTCSVWQTPVVEFSTEQAAPFCTPPLSQLSAPRFRQFCEFALSCTGRSGA